MRVCASDREQQLNLAFPSLEEKGSESAGLKHWHRGELCSPGAGRQTEGGCGWEQDACHAADTCREPQHTLLLATGYILTLVLQGNVLLAGLVLCLHGSESFSIFFTSCGFSAEQCG